MVTGAAIEWGGTLVEFASRNPSAVVGILTIFSGAVYYRLSNLTSREDRELYLNEKFQNRRWREGHLKAEFDALNMVESSGVEYWFRRYGLGQIDGYSVVSLNSNFMIDDQLWEQDALIGRYLDVVDCHVDFRNWERLNEDTYQLVLKVNSVDQYEISKATAGLIKHIMYLDKNAEGVSLGFGPPEIESDDTSSSK